MLFSGLFLPYIFTYSYLSYQKKCVRKKVKREIIASIDSADLVLLAFTKIESANLSWEHAKEFEFQDKMYDIVYRKETRDSTFYWCWLDHEETNLNKKLSELSTISWNQNKEKKDKTQKLAQWGKDLYFESTKSPMTPLIRSVSLCYVYTQKSNNFYLTALSPPPEI